MLVNTNKKYIFVILQDIANIKFKEALPFTLSFFMGVEYIKTFAVTLLKSFSKWFFMMNADIFQVIFWVNPGMPKVCGFNTCFLFIEVHQTNLSGVR